MSDTLSAQDDIDALRADLLKRVNIVNNVGSVQTLTERLELDHIDVGVGYRPSGNLHLGNLTSATIAAYVAHYVNPTSSSVKITNCDLELPISDDVEQVMSLIDDAILGDIESVAVYFKYLQSSITPDLTMAEEHSRRINAFLAELGKQRSIHVNDYHLSEVQSEAGYRRALKRFCDRIEGIAPFFPDFRGEGLKLTGGGIYIFPVCPTCHTGNKEGSLVKNGHVYASCKPCNKRYDFDLDDPEYEVAVNFLVDPIRDLDTSASVHVHVFGGDYGDGIDQNFSKIEKVAAIQDVVHTGGQTLPILFLGPTVYCKDGRAMGKRYKKGLTIASLEEAMSIDVLAQKTWAYTESILQQGLLNVDYTYTRDRFF